MLHCLDIEAILRVLIIEDDVDIATNLFDFLGSRGHVVDHASDGLTGLHLAVANDYDALLLDVALPGIDGLALCRKLRTEARRATPVLMLTARDTLADKLAGFDNGADDYLVKPYALQEVEARLLALIRRSTGRVAERILNVGDLRFDPSSLSVTRANMPVRLPPKCVRILESMMSRPGHVFSRTELETAAWGEPLVGAETLRTHMHLLRRALAIAGREDPIETVHGLGYRLVAR